MRPDVTRLCLGALGLVAQDPTTSAASRMWLERVKQALEQDLAAPAIEAQLGPGRHRCRVVQIGQELQVSFEGHRDSCSDDWTQATQLLLGQPGRYPEVSIFEDPAQHAPTHHQELVLSRLANYTPAQESLAGAHEVGVSRPKALEPGPAAMAQPTAQDPSKGSWGKRASVLLAIQPGASLLRPVAEILQIRASIKHLQRTRGIRFTTKRMSPDVYQVTRLKA